MYDLPVCTIAGQSSVCAGGSAQLCAPAGLSSYKWNTGSTSSCITVNASGNYSVTVTNANGCSSTCTKSFVVNPLPSCAITGNSSVCPGGSIQLCAPAGLASYLWSNGAKTQCITVSAPGNYSVTVTNTNGCSSTCNKSITSGSLPNCSITGPNSICAGSSAQLCAPSGLASYLWSNGAKTQCITVTAQRNYSVTVTNTSGCTSTCNKTIAVISLPTVTISNITPKIDCRTNTIYIGYGPQSITLSASASAGVTYKWRKNNAFIVSATLSTYTTATAGDYSVVVTNTAGCSAASNIITIKVIDVRCGSDRNKVQVCHRTTIGSQSLCVAKTLVPSHLSHGDCLGSCAPARMINPDHESSGELNVNVFPNPTSGKIIVQFYTNAKEKYVLNVIDLLGNLIMRMEKESVEGENFQELDLSNAARGMYFISVEKNGEEKIVKKVSVE